MPGGVSGKHLIPARLTRSLFVVSMALSLLRVVGFGATSRPSACVGASNRVVARLGSTTMVSMASELSKTTISRMRVAELRQELAKRGLESDGIRPVLQARLAQAAEVERAESVIDRHRAHQLPSSDAWTRPAASGSITGAPQRPARDASLSKQTRRGAFSQRARSMSTTSPDPLRSPEYVMQFDGGSRGNPGPSGAGAVLYRLGEGGTRVEVWSGSVWVGQRRTNNEAEYSGLIEGLRAAKELGIKRLAVEGDSDLVIQQMLGNYKVSSPKMAPLFKKAKSIAKSFDKLELEHIPRARNGRADTLANVAMDTEKSKFNAPELW